jgi:tetratricopeptide (TPR) repeat protein
VLAWSLSAQGDLELGLRMTMVWGAWPSIFESYESYEWFEQALRHIRGIDPLPKALLARVLYKLGKILELSMGNSARATMLLEESLTLFQALGDRTNMAEALDSLGRAARDQGDYQRAQTLGEQALLLFRAENDAEDIAVALMSLGDVALDQGDTIQATARFEEALAMCRVAGNRFRSGWALINLGRVAYALGDHARAQTLYEETLALFRELDGSDGVIQTLLELGRVAHAEGDVAGAAAYFKESLAFRPEQRLDQRAHAYGLEGLAGVAVARGHPVRAGRLFGAAAALRDSADFPLSPVMRADYERDLAAARAQLDEATFAVAWAAGRGLLLEQAIAYALEG